ncbi:LacI family DNA-binding transcriptional regulator [Oceanispirochaeta sp.]|uniref:LacI family DNA-binding transcriptional regulator n=1 Tax=Oceanispirochaeta sp. TaxID=2035350 RepID=UPI0026087B75|nr:LacI family DNA-binding transcriptional regulator [Oceanispirochaeta sp.]MDA3955761.1 LacI family DNA-binding transcriptional regulator [Oceanispirochaeta sp.]
MKKKTSIKDVARYAGVSPSTVSAVVNNNVGKGIRVGKETQEKIRKAVKDLGYMPSPAAQSLVTGISHIISVFTYEAAFPFAAESEFYSFLLGIEKKAEITGFDLLLITNKKFRTETDRQEQVDLNRLKLGDGGILIGIKRHTETLLRLIDDGFPLVFIGRRDMMGRKVNMVNYDYDSIIFELVKYSYNLGHKKVSYIRKLGNQEPYEDRQKALNTSMDYWPELSCRTIILEDSLTSMDIEACMSQGITLFFLERKSLAIRLQELCNEMGLTLGEDISAVLLEDQWFSSDIQWTCWSNVRDELGKMSVALLNDIISAVSNEPITRRIVPDLVKGETIRSISFTLRSKS